MTSIYAPFAKALQAEKGRTEKMKASEPTIIKAAMTTHGFIARSAVTQSISPHTTPATRMARKIVGEKRAARTKRARVNQSRSPPHWRRAGPSSIGVGSRVPREPSISISVIFFWGGALIRPETPGKRAFIADEGTILAR
jgi:hypothetical protein